MPESTNTQDFVARPDVDDQISVAPPTELSPAQSTAQASDIPSPTQQSAADNVAQVKFFGPGTWGDTRIKCITAGIQTFANKSVSQALIYRPEGRSAARTMQDMGSFVSSQTGSLKWSPSEVNSMREGSLKPTDAETYKAWAAKTMPTLQKMAEEYNGNKNDEEVEISVLADDQVPKSGYSLVMQHRMENNAYESSKSRLEREKSRVAASRAERASAQ
jgi:hypothetical protein